MDKLYHQEKGRKHYANNRQLYLTRSRGYRIENRAGNEKIVAEAKSVGCSRCGERDPIVLAFHHLGDKKDNVASMMTGTPKRLLAEIAKCVVVCQNCHVRIHHEERKMVGSHSGIAKPS